MNKKFWKGIIIGLLLLLPSLGWSATHYVSNDGDDTNNGTVETPFEHIPGGTGCSDNCSTAAAALTGDDFILLNKDDTWASTTVTFPVGGTSGHQITLGAYGTGAKPIISATATNPAITVTAANRGYWTIDGLDLRSSGDVEGGMSLSIYHAYWPADEGAVPGWIIQNCDSNSAFWLFGPDTLVKDNHLDGSDNAVAGTNVLGGIFFRGAVTQDCIAEGNTVHDFVDRGIWYMGGSDGGIARNNTIYNITGGGSNDGMGINFDGYLVPVENGKSYGNHIYDCDGIGITHENGFGSESYNNLIHDCTMGGIDIINYDPYFETAANISIHHNIIYNTNIGIPIYNAGTFDVYNNVIHTGTGADSAAFYVLTASTYVEAINFRNNIISGVWTHPIWTIDNNYTIWTTLDHNFITPNGTEVYREAGVSRTLAYMQALDPVLMADSSVADPLFTNAAGGVFTLKYNSPCEDAGFNLGSSYDDAFDPRDTTFPYDTVDQDLYGSGWEIGAFAYLGGLSGIVRDWDGNILTGGAKIYAYEISVAAEVATVLDQGYVGSATSNSTTGVWMIDNIAEDEYMVIFEYYGTHGGKSKIAGAEFMSSIDIGVP